jgi:hypothetical protein
MLGSSEENELPILRIRKEVIMDVTCDISIRCLPEETEDKYEKAVTITPN